MFESCLCILVLPTEGPSLGCLAKPQATPCTAQSSAHGTGHLRTLHTWICARTDSAA